MSDRGQLPWLRLGAEGVLIVASILAAFAVDTVWSGRQDRHLERTELLGLQEQLMDTRAQLQRVIAEDEWGLASSDRLLALLESGFPDDVMVVDTLLRAQGSTTMFVAPMSRFDALLASGRLVLVEDPDLRALIAEWPERVGGVTEVAVRRRNHYELQFLPNMRTGYDLGEFLGGFRPTEGRMVTVHSDPVFLNLVRERRFFDSVLLGREVRLLERLDLLLAEIAAVLDESV